MEKVIIKNPNESPIITEVESVTLEYLQSVVGGYVEQLYIPQFDDVAGEIFCLANDAGKLNGLDANFPLVTSSGQVYTYAVGTVIFCGRNENNDLAGLTDEYVDRVMTYLADPMVYPTTPFNIGFISTDGGEFEIQLEVDGGNESDMYANLFNLIQSLREELNLDELTYIERA